MTMNGNKTTYPLLVILGSVLGYLGSELVGDTKSELAAQRITNNVQNEKIARMDEQLIYLKADLQDIKASQALILKAVGVK